MDVGLLHHVAAGEGAPGRRGDHHATRRADGLDLAGDGHVPRPDVEFELSGSHHSAEDRPGVYPDAHLDRQLCPLPELVQSIYDGQSHVHAVVGMVDHGLGAAGDAEVAVSEGADLLALVLRHQLVKLGEYLVQNAHQIGSRETGGELCEINNVSKKDRHPVHGAHGEGSRERL